MSLLVDIQGSQCNRFGYLANTWPRLGSLAIHNHLFVVTLLASFFHYSQQQSSISLNSAQWFVSNANGSMILPAQVPGGIYSDLRRNNVLKQDILYGKNDIAYRWVGQENWTYTAAFAIDQQIATSQSVKLVLHGVDTVAKVYLNGEEVGSTDNMFVRYKFDIKPHLKLAGLKNIIAIKFESPIKYSAKRSNQSIRQNRGKVIPPYCPSPAQRGECHVNFIRKMQASFSWDWGPAFPSMGIYKNIDIEFGSFGMIRDILVETRRQGSLVQLPFRRTSSAPTQVIISSNIRHNVQTPTLNRTVPYIRAPPYYLGSSSEVQAFEQMERLDLVDNSQQQLMEENWLLKITLVVEMAQASFGYNVRVEFNLNSVLHYESEHINVVANPDGYIRLGFNLRIDSSRMRVKPWWPNNAGTQNLYRLTARVMPIPSAPERIRLRTSDPGAASPVASGALDASLLQARAKPLQTPASPPLSFLMSSSEDTYQAQYLSEKEVVFGFRTVELIQEPITRGQIEDGLTFNFRINGVDLFAMGSNWIPASVLPENANDLEYVRYLLQSAKDANMNMLRVWGGGLYESDEFYRMADEMGLMIWHDFMFACALYPVDDDFIASVRLEVEQQVQRLQHHPSIVLWAGNNENEMAIAGPWWPEVMVWNKNLRESYHKLYVETIKPIVQILDPTRPYVESSPSNGLQSLAQTYAISRTPNDNKFGDVHHYDYLSDSFEWSNYPSTRFASEYGFQSYPSFNALASVSAASDWKYPLTANILHRQHRLTGETEIKLQIKLHFNEPKAGGVDKFKTFLYVSQLTQAIAIKTETEFYRRNRFIDPETKLGKTMGALYWQLNDVWPAPSWSSIEFGGKWKMLHYFARRFFFPIQVMPYLVQPPSTAGSVIESNGAGGSLAGALQQALQAGSSMIERFTSSSSASLASQQFNNGQQQQQQQQSGGPLLVVDLVRDDLFELLDSFNVSVRFYRWTSFTPVWQDVVYVRNARPQNVTRIYEQELARVARHPGVISISSGVFQVVIEQQPRLGLSQIENYLMPVAPSRVTAMRVAKINVELVQGPFELADVGGGGGGASAAAPSERHAGRHNSQFQTATNQWSCAYRLTLVSDSIAMYVWLDLNFLNSGTPSGAESSPGAASVQLGDQSSRPGQQQPAPQRGAQLATPEHIRLELARPYRPRGDNEDADLSERAPERLVLDLGGQAAAAAQPPRAQQARRTHEQQQPPFKPADATGGNMLRYQFSDNAFNMLEPSKVVDLYLSRCLSRAQVEVALEVQSLADSL